MTQTHTPPRDQREYRKIRRLRSMVALVGNLLRDSEMPLPEAIRLVGAVRAQALRLFPGHEAVYDRIYAPRFARVLRDRYDIPEPGE